jgi:polyhydroxyalkanoate synthesis regulator phasin
MAEHHPPDDGDHLTEHHHPEHYASEGSERVREVIRDGFTIMLGAASWAFDQGDRLVDTWMQQGQVSREQSRRRFEDFAHRTRQAGEDLGRRVQDGVRTARSSMSAPTREQVANLERQVAELTRQIESLRSSAGSPPSSSTGRGSKET